MKNYDVLLVARMDHSIQIYNALEKQSKIKFLYITYRVFPRCLKRVFSKLISRITYVGKDCKILLWPTIASILGRDLGVKKITSYSELSRFEDCVPSVLKSRSARIIHYWPEYCGEAVSKWKKDHANAVFLADVYYPNPNWVIKNMAPLYEKYGLKLRQYVFNYASSIENQLKDADYIVVSSNFMVDTLKENFPDKKYLVVPYGISKSPLYKLNYKTSIREFAYVGAITIDKGVDILLECFKRRPSLRLHIFGNESEQQKHIFEQYMGLDNVVFHGHCSKPQMQELFDSTIDAGIHLSRYDAYSLAVGEEIGAGLPVLVSNYTGIKDDVVKNNWGVVADVNDFNDILSKIDMLCNPDIYNDYKTSIDEYLKNTHKKFGENMIEIYHSLLK